LAAEPGEELERPQSMTWPCLYFADDGLPKLQKEE